MLISESIFNNALDESFYSYTVTDWFISEKVSAACLLILFTFILFLIYLFIQYFKRVTHLAVMAILPCDPLCKHIYIYTKTKVK